MEEYKGYTIKSCDDIIGYEIECIGRGSIHLSLRGMYTSKLEARKSIDTYEKRKEEDHGQNVQRGGDKQIQRRIKYRRKPTNSV